MDLEQQPAAPRLTGFHDPPTLHPHENDHSHTHDSPHAHSHEAPHAHSHDAPQAHSHDVPHAHSHDNAPHSHSHSDPSSSHGHSHHGGVTILSAPRKRYRPTEYDMDKLRSTMKQFVRDWSVEVLSFPCVVEGIMLTHPFVCRTDVICTGKGRTRSRVRTYERSFGEPLR